MWLDDIFNINSIPRLEINPIIYIKGKLEREIEIEIEIDIYIYRERERERENKSTS